MNAFKDGSYNGIGFIFKYQGNWYIRPVSIDPADWPYVVNAIIALQASEPLKPIY